MKNLLRSTLRSLGLILVAVCMCLQFPRNAEAYIDPATGSVVVQVLLAVFVGIMVTIKLFWAKIRLFFETIFGRKRSDKPTEE